MNNNYISNTMDLLFYKICYDLMHDPDYINPNNQLRELINPTLELTDIRNRIIMNPGRNLSKKYLAGELAFYFNGSNLLEDILPYSKFWKNVSDDGKHVNSGYGKYIFKEDTKGGKNQVEYVIENLIRNRQSKNAVITIYDHKKHSYLSRDNPCTMYLHFLIRYNKLYCITHMRSNDIWFGLSYDLPFFTILQELIHLRLVEHYPNLELGSYIHNAGSLHFYDKDFERIKYCIEEYKVIEDFEQFIDMPPLQYNDIDLYCVYEDIHRNRDLFSCGELINIKKNIRSPLILKLISYLEEK